MSKKILVTGAMGFTGKYICQLFESKGYLVLKGAIDSLDEYNTVLFDILSPENMLHTLKMHKPDGIIHLAGCANVAHGSVEDFYKINTIGAINLLESAQKSNINFEKIVIASSANVYGNSEKSILSEFDKPAPVNHYANSKLAMEALVQNWFTQLPIIITRPFNYTGVGQSTDYLIPKIVSHFKDKKDSIELGNIDVSRDFSDVRDISKAYYELYACNSHSEIVNLCTGKPISLSDIIKFCEKLTSHQINVNVNPNFVRKNEIKSLSGDNSKLFSLTGYKPTTDLKITLKDMLFDNGDSK